MSINITAFPTASGLQRATDAAVAGFAVSVKYIAVGSGRQQIVLDDGGRAITDTLKSLVGHIEVLKAEQVGDYQWQISIDLVGLLATEWTFAEFALCDADKKVIAIYGNPTQSIYTVTPVLDNALLAINLVLGTFPAGSIVIEHHNIPLELIQDDLTAGYAKLAADALQTRQHDKDQDASIADVKQSLAAAKSQLTQQIGSVEKASAINQASQRRELLLLLAWKQATDAMYIRARGWSGLLAVRQYIYHGGQDNLRGIASSEKGTPGHIHNHPEWGDLLGTGEVWAVINGWQFKARHRDHHLERPANVGSAFLTTEKLLPPALPASVTGTIAQQTAAITDLYSRYAAGEFPPGFRADLTALECWLEPYSDSISDTFHSDRHALQVSNMMDALRLLLHYSASGLKDRYENQSVEMPLVAWVDDKGEPQLAILRYRMICTSLESMGDVRPYIEGMEGLIFNIGWARESGRFRVIENQDSPGALDTMMGLLPGLDGTGANLTETHTRYGVNDNVRQYADSSKPLNAAYYNRFAQVMGDDAANRQTFIRSDYDPYLFVSSNTRPEVLDMGFQGNPHRWSWGIPMEIVIRHPLETWNPYSVPTYTGSTRKGYSNGYGTSFSNPIPGLNADFGMFFKTPAEIFAGASSAEAADTATGEYWVTCGDGAARKMRASGLWVETPPFANGIGQIRLRYPIHPEHQEGDKAHAAAVAMHRETAGNLARVMADSLIQRENAAALQKQITGGAA